jgi:hypothetical protein
MVAELTRELHVGSSKVLQMFVLIRWGGGGGGGTSRGMRWDP